MVKAEALISWKPDLLPALPSIADTNMTITTTIGNFTLESPQNQKIGNHPCNIKLFKKCKSKSSIGYFISPEVPSLTAQHGPKYPTERECFLSIRLSLQAPDLSTSRLETPPDSRLSKLCNQQNNPSFSMGLKNK